MSGSVGVISTVFGSAPAAAEKAISGSTVRRFGQLGRRCAVEAGEAEPAGEADDAARRIVGGQVRDLVPGAGGQPRPGFDRRGRFAGSDGTAPEPVGADGLPTRDARALGRAPDEATTDERDDDRRRGRGDEWPAVALGDDGSRWGRALRFGARRRRFDWARPRARRARRRMRGSGRADRPGRPATRCR